MAKNIVFCADGTWNDPYQDENEDHCADPTNVYKLYLWWLAVIIFDLAFVWHRYIRHDQVREVLKKCFTK